MIYLAIFMFWFLSCAALYVRARMCPHCSGTGQGCRECVFGCGFENPYSTCKRCAPSPDAIIDRWKVLSRRTYLRAPNCKSALAHCRAKAPLRRARNPTVIERGSNCD